MSSRRNNKARTCVILRFKEIALSTSGYQISLIMKKNLTAKIFKFPSTSQYEIE